MFLTAGAGDAATRNGRAGNWYGLLGPARMPPEAAQRIATVAGEALNVAANAERYRALAALPAAMGPAETGTVIAAERARWAPLVDALDIRLE